MSGGVTEHLLHSNEERTMPRAISLVGALCAGALALGLALAANSASRAADCLAEPDFRIPGPGHWFYRVDRATNKKCWYFKREAGEPTKAAPAATAPAPLRDAAAPSVAGRYQPRLTEAPKRTASSGEKAPYDGPKLVPEKPRLNSTSKEALFQDFLQWRERQGHEP
jgi:hypothetical protein